MEFERFRGTLTARTAPRGLPAHLLALWHEACGDWARAHEIVAAERTKAAARVHAYLHRKEGDSANADYWYARAGEKRPRGSFEKEWEALARSLLSG